MSTEHTAPLAPSTAPTIATDDRGLPLTVVDAVRRTAAEVGNTRGLHRYVTHEQTEFRGWGDLERAARAGAASLQARGLGPGDTVVLALDPGYEFVECCLATMFAGCAVVPAPVTGFGTQGVPAGRILGLAEASGAAYVLTHEPVLARLADAEGRTGAESLAGVELVAADDLVSSGDPDAWREPAIDGDSTALLMFTSGSTGDPKGVIGTHANIMETAFVMGPACGVERGATLVGWAPLHHVMGLFVQVLNPACHGATSVLIPTEIFQRRPLLWLQAMSDFQATTSVGGNFAFSLMTRLASDDFVATLDLSHVVSLMSGSEPVLASTVHAFVEKFAAAGLKPNAVAPAYGMTEAMAISISPLLGDLVIERFDVDALEHGRLQRSSEPGAAEWVSNGPAPEGVTVVIVDPDTHEILPDGEVGEIWAASKMIAAGYYRRPEATAETFGWTQPGHEGKEFLRTGDLGALLDDELYITGRVKDLIIVRGRNIYPQDIEASARKVTGAGIGAAFELADARTPVGIVLELEADADGAVREDLEALAGELVEHLMRAHSLPAVAVAIQAPGHLPRTAAGKVRRSLTRAGLLDGTLPVLHSVGVPQG